jgi:CBS domain-containing protein
MKPASVEVQKSSAFRSVKRRSALAEATNTSISSVMTLTVITVRADFSIESLIELMLRHDVSRVPVIDGSGKLVGMVSKTDLVAEQYQKGDIAEEETHFLRSDATRPYPPTGFHVHQIPDAVVADVMTRTVVTLPEDASIAGASELMAAHHLHCLPIVSKTGNLVGLISSLDVVGWVAGLV